MAASISLGLLRGRLRRLFLDIDFGERRSDGDCRCRSDGLPSFRSFLLKEAVGQLVPLGSNASLRFHLRPIDVVVFHGPSAPEGAWSIHLGAGFALRCFQRLSVPHVATRRCTWRHNRHTSGASISVLSYWRPPSSMLPRPPQIGTELSYDVLNPARVPL